MGELRYDCRFVDEMIGWNMLWLALAVRLRMNWYGERDVEMVSESETVRVRE